MKNPMTAACLAALFASAALHTSAASAAPESPKEMPCAFGLLPACQWPDESWSVTGARLNLFAGRHDNVLFFSLSGIADLVNSDMCGLEISGLYNHVGRSSGAFQLAGLVNSCDRDFSGVQLSGLYAAAGGRLAGLSVAGMTRAETLDGLQVGIFNKATSLNGVQIGVVNFAENSTGIQLGLVNVMNDGRYPVMFVFNAAF